MPRLPLQDHLGRRDLLVLAWREFPELFGTVSPRAQWEVHRFYRPYEMHTDDEVLAHVKALAESDPTLVHRVGKHYRVMQDVFIGVTDRVGLTNWEALVAELHRGRVHVPASGTRAKAAGKQRNIRLVAIVNPVIDVQKLGRILLAVAEHETKKRKTAA